MAKALEERLSKGIFFVDLKASQFSAIRCSVKFGKALQESIPQIADNYRKGMSLKEIEGAYDIAGANGISKSTATEAVRYALSGYRQNFRFVHEPNYDGLIPSDEYDSLAKQHHSDNARKIDKRMRKTRGGVYAITASERIESGRKGAKIQIEKKIGIHAQTLEDHQEVGRWGAEACGFKIWSDEEKLSALDMATHPDGKYQRGSRIAIGKIAGELNESYHEGGPIRTPRAVAKFLSDYNEGLRQ